MLFVTSIENLKYIKYRTSCQTLVLSIICGKCINEDEKVFKEEKSIEILKILGVIRNMEEYWKNIKS